MSILDHIVLFLILFTVFFLLTKLPQHILNKHFWGITSVPIVIYSLILGCRYGWGHDFLWYKLRFENPYFYKDESPGFQWVNITIGEWGGDYTGAYIIYSLVFILGAYILLKSYKENKYMLFLFIPATLLQSTFTIRQSFATSFVFAAIYFFNKKNWIGVIFMSLITLSIHTAAIIPLLLYVIIYFIYSKPLPIKITIPAYITIFIFASLFAEKLLDLLNLGLANVSLDSKFQSYIDHADNWFSVDAQREEFKQGFLTSSLMLAFHLSIIYIGFNALKRKPIKSISVFYNIVVIGIIGLKIFFDLEILRRILNPLFQLYFIPMGYGIYIYATSMMDKENKKIRAAIIYFAIYLFLYYSRFIFLSPNYIFYWNQN